MLFAARRISTLTTHLLSPHSITSQTQRRAMSNMKKLDINSSVKMPSGYQIPLLGYGVYQTPADIAEDVVHHALKTGYRHVDSAAAYRNEAPSAAGVQASKLPRSSIFYTSKVPPKSMSYEGAKIVIEDTMAAVGDKLDGYVDLYLLHCPYGGREARLGAWKALVEAVEAGKIRSIGVSNYGVHHLQELEDHIKEVDAKEGKGKGGVLSVNQVELHPWLARPDIVKWCQDRDIILEAYSPLVRGREFENPLLVDIAKKHNKTAAQVLVRWSLQKAFVPLPKSITKERIEQNAKVFDFELDEDDMKKLELDDYKPCAWDPTVAKLED